MAARHGVCIGRLGAFRSRRPSSQPRPPPGRRTAPRHSNPVDRPAVVGHGAVARGAPYRNGGDRSFRLRLQRLCRLRLRPAGPSHAANGLEQYAQGQPVGQDRRRPGDLVSSARCPGASHVGIAISRDEFVHAASSSGVVRVESLNAPYWSSDSSGRGGSLSPAARRRQVFAGSAPSRAPPTRQITVSPCKH